MAYSSSDTGGFIGEESPYQDFDYLTFLQRFIVEIDECEKLLIFPSNITQKEALERLYNVLCREFDAIITRIHEKDKENIETKFKEIQDRARGIDNLKQCFSMGIDEVYPYRQHLAKNEEKFLEIKEKLREIKIGILFARDKKGLLLARSKVNPKERLKIISKGGIDDRGKVILPTQEI